MEEDKVDDEIDEESAPSSWLLGKRARSTHSRITASPCAQLPLLPTVLNITKCFVGAASFELPFAFAQAGTLGSMAGVVFLAVLSSFSLQKLAACSDLVASLELAASLSSSSSTSTTRRESLFLR